MTLQAELNGPCTKYVGITHRHRADFKCRTNLLEHILRATLTAEERSTLTVVFPYLSRAETAGLILRNQYTKLFRPAERAVFVTSENTAPRWALAPYQVGFCTNVDSPRYLRFPNWMLHLDWSELPSQPPNNRYGVRLDIDQLMRPIAETYGDESRKHTAVMFSSHLKEPRGTLFNVVDQVIGCSGFGKVFNTDTRRRGGKFEDSKGFLFALCPENSIGSGYITEKIPEAFYAGCIPMTWCRPEDLAQDFNPAAVVNLYGLDEHERVETLTRLRDNDEYRAALRSEPLLLKRPSLQPIIQFLQGMVRGDL